MKEKRKGSRKIQQIRKKKEKKKSDGNILNFFSAEKSNIRDVVIVQLPSHVWHCFTPWIASCQASLFFTISQNLLKLMSIESVMLSTHPILCHPLLLLPSIFPSIRVFSIELALWIRWSKYWSFSFSISPFNEYSELISFRIDWFDLLVIQVVLKSILQHHNLKASILQCSAFLEKP